MRFFILTYSDTKKVYCLDVIETKTEYEFCSTYNLEGDYKGIACSNFQDLIDYFMKNPGPVVYSKIIKIEEIHLNYLYEKYKDLI